MILHSYQYFIREGIFHHKMSSATTPRNRLTIPLCQRIALFACRGPKDAFLLAVTNELFRETMIDYNTMHTVFCRRFWQDNNQIHYNGSTFRFVLRVVENNVTWITQILINALYYSCEKAKEESERKEITFDNTTELSTAIYKLVRAALGHNDADMSLELLRAFKILFSFDSIDGVDGIFFCDVVMYLVLDACSNCCDVRVIKELRSWNAVDWPIPIFDRTDENWYTALEKACSTHSTAPNAIEFFTELLTFDDHSQIAMVGGNRVLYPLSMALRTLCECTDQPELVEFFDKLLIQNFADRDNAALGTIWQGQSAAYNYGEFPLSAAAANCHHRVLITVMSCIRNLSNSNIGEIHLPLELYAKTNTGFTPFLAAVAKGLIKNVKILIAQSESKEEYQEKWLNRMVDMKGQNAIALCGDANEELKEFLLQEDCWEVSRRFYVQEMEKLSEVKKESGARRQREEGNAE